MFYVCFIIVYHYQCLIAVIKLQACLVLHHCVIVVVVVVIFVVVVCRVRGKNILLFTMQFRYSFTLFFFMPTANATEVVTLHCCSCCCYCCWKERTPSSSSGSSCGSRSSSCNTHTLDWLRFCLWLPLLLARLSIVISTLRALHTYACVCACVCLWVPVWGRGGVPH